MKIKELKAKQTNVNIVADVIDMGSVREFNKFGKSGRVCNATVKDETGEVKLSLWNEQVDKVKKGDRIEIKNGYVNEWQGELQLTTGKFGTLEVVGSSSDENVQAVTEDEFEEKEILEGEKGPEHVLTKDEKTEEEDAYETKKDYKKQTREEVETKDEETEEEKFEDQDLDVEEEQID